MKQLGAWCIVLFLLCASALNTNYVSANSLLVLNPHPYEISIHSSDTNLKQVLATHIEAHRGHVFAQERPLGGSRLMEKDIEVLTKALHSQGYYEGVVNFEQITRKSKDEKRFIYHIVEGARYAIGKVEFKQPEYLEKDFDFDFGLNAGEPLLAEKVLASRDRLQKKLEESCLLEVDLRHKVTLFMATHSGDIRFSIKKTRKARIDQLSFVGLESIEENYLRNRLDISQGDCFSRSKLEQARIDLLQTNLLAKVEATIEYDENSSDIADQFVPVTINFKVEERKHKTVKFGVGYSTDEGAGARVGWEHRNMFGAGEDLEVEMGSNKVRQFLNGDYRMSDFFKKDQTLTLKTELKKETTDAFESSKAKSSAIVSRKLSKNILGDLGVALSHSEVTEDEDKKRFNLFSIPTRLSVEARNNVLDPTSGWHATTSLTPFTDLANEDVRFLQWTANASTYLTAKVAMHPTVALRMALGASTGTALDNIPADERYYVGGGGSVRGYAYQTVGNLTDGDADGGKSFAELSVELRLKLSESWGFAIFTDGGYAYPEELPEFGKDFLWGAGLGIRYHTGFAPIRFDIAVPLDRREGVDDSVQFYVSIGQSF